MFEINLALQISYNYYLYSMADAVAPTFAEIIALPFSTDDATKFALDTYTLVRPTLGAINTNADGETSDSITITI